MAKKASEKMPFIPILEVVDNLTTMAELMPEQINGEGKAPKWLDLKDEKKTVDHVKETFKALKNYIEKVSVEEERQLEQADTQNRLKAIMLLADEAADHLDKFTALFKQTKLKVSEFKEFKDLKDIYLNKIVKRFHEVIKQEEVWQQEWSTGEEDVLDIKRRGLKDLQTVMRDRHYELFFIRKEDGKPFFNRNVIRHIKLVTDFDEFISAIKGDDPLIKIPSILDRDAYLSALELKEAVKEPLRAFCLEAFKYKQQELTMIILKACMALFLAANPRNLTLQAIGKNCLSYFKDFHMFLRQALNTEDYQFIISHPSQEGEFSIIMAKLLHHLCFAFFKKVGDRDEALSHFHRMVQKGKGVKKPHHSISSSISIWNTLLEDHEYLESLLKRYPSGPLMKTLDLLQAREDIKGFDPIGQNNLPQFLYSLEFEDIKCACIRLPCPTFQENISKAKINEEYSAFLRALKKQEKHLLINLQDKTSWEEHARSEALEKLSKNAEFSKKLVVVTLPRNTSFYNQSEEYIDLGEAKDFKKRLKEQWESGEACGFYIPQALKKEIASFVKKSIETIHEIFFGKNEILLRKNRCDFIEIFYQFITLKLIDLIKPSIISFTCKDAIDVGPATSALFFGFLKLLSGKSQFLDKDKDFLEWMLFYSALFIRERAIEISRLNRAISCISVIHAEIETNRKDIIKELEALFGHKTFQKTRINFDIAPH